MYRLNEKSCLNTVLCLLLWWFRFSRSRHQGRSVKGQQIYWEKCLGRKRSEESEVGGYWLQTTMEFWHEWWRNEDCLERASDFEKVLESCWGDMEHRFPTEGNIHGSEMADSDKYPCCAHSRGRSSLKLAVLDSL